MTVTALNALHPIILCGGSGTRLWPLSRKSYPKQFVPLTGRESLFVASAGRLSGEGFAPPVVVTGSDFRFIVTEQLLEAGVDPGAILIEPGDAGLRIRAEREQGPWYRRGGAWWRPQTWREE